ncbi:MAG TPA: phosphate ABC transporter substrate-binding protein PstS [Actinocatenispora sp.]
MKLQRHGALAALAITATLAMAACGSDNTGSGDSKAAAKAPSTDCAKGSLTAQGSTAQKNAMDQWIKAYQQKCSGAKITYDGTGSGAGIQAFTSGTADFAGSDSALKDGAEQTGADKRCKGGEALDLPMVTGPIAVVYNIGDVKGLQFRPATLAKIFSGKIKTWNDPAIKADNPSAKLPSTPIQAVHRADSSGTSDNFTKYLSKTAPADWTYDHAKEWKAPGGIAAAKSDGVSSKVHSTVGTIAYDEWSYATTNGLNIAKIYNGSGQYTELTAAAAGKTIEGAKVVGKGNNLKLDIDYNAKVDGAYPIVLVTYEIACSTGNASDKLPLLKSFLTYVSSDDGQAALTEQGYAPLPKSVQTKVQAAVKALA